MMDDDSAVVCCLDEIRFWKIVCKYGSFNNVFCADNAMKPNHSPSLNQMNHSSDN
jgi:hypothetical protein